MELANGLKLRDFDEECAPIGKHVRALYLDRIVSRRVRPADGEFRRAIARRVTIVPDLREMPLRLLHSHIKRVRKTDEDAIVMRVKFDRQLCRRAGPAQALKATIVWRVAAPSLATTDVELSILWIETSAMNPTAKFFR